MNKWSSWDAVLDEKKHKTLDISTENVLIFIPLIGGIAIFIILSFVQPPFVKIRSVHEYHMAELSWRKVIIWSLILTIIMYVLPHVLRKYHNSECP